MKHYPAWILVLFVLAAGGCQGNPQVRRVVDSYNAENRQLEDTIYLLEQDIQVLEQENAHLRQQIERGGTTGSAPAATPRRGGLFPRRGGTAPTNPPDGGGLDLEMPSTPRNRPSNKPAVPEEPDVGPILEGPDKKPAAGPDEKPAELPAPPAKKTEPEVLDKKVTHVFLNPLHTSGTDFDHSPGDDGLTVLLEPRNAANQFVPLAGPVSVVVLDSSKEGESARIARWDFSQAEAAERLVAGEARGIQLKLPWPAKPPENARLDVFVRYETPDGQKLQAEKEVLVALPGQFSQRWTPRSSDRPRPASSSPAIVEPAGPQAAPLAAQPDAKQQPAASTAATPAPGTQLPAAVPVEKAPALLTPPPGLSERPSGEKASRPKWSPTR